MNSLRTFIGFGQARHLTRIKLALLLSFCNLVFFQFLVGFTDFEDYLILFIFVLFLNDQYLKMKSPSSIQLEQDGVSRFAMSIIFGCLFLSSFLLDSLDISDAMRLTIFKFGFVLWAQVFLIDSFIHYKETHSKQWLVFANMAVLMIIIGAFIN